MISEAKKRAKEKYDQTDKGKEVKKKSLRKYRQTVKYKTSKHEYQQTDKYKNDQRRCRLQTRYHMSLEDHNLLFEQQGGRCRICNKEFNLFNPLDMCVDHNQITGKVRALLCRKCNLALGHFDENIQRLMNAIKYLRETDGEKINEV